MKKEGLLLLISVSISLNFPLFLELHSPFRYPFCTSKFFVFSGYDMHFDIKFAYFDFLQKALQSLPEDKNEDNIDE